MTHDKKKKQDLGIFYTREEIVNFIYDVLLLWKEMEDKEENRWESHKPKHYPSVIDPACGEGIFLKKALEKKFTTPQYIWGIDIDEHAKDKWEKINLLKSFGSEAKLDIHFFHQNGLLPLDEKKILRYKKGGLKDFDAVVGNPPYGGIGIGIVNGGLEQALVNFEIWKRPFRKAPTEDPHQLLLPVEIKESNIRKSEKDRLKSFPIEVLFIDRFIQLAKPGGWIAIIIPDGILSNSNLYYVRQYIANNARVEAIVSLPRDAFKHVGTSAKTSILFLKKHSSSPLLQKVDSGGFDYPVFLASLENVTQTFRFEEILLNYKEFYMKQTLRKDKKVYFNDFVMVRVDKTMRGLFAEKPSTRWDGSYWLPKYDELFAEIGKKHTVNSLDNYILSIDQGDVPRKAKGDKYVNKGVIFINVADVVSTGVFWVQCKKIIENHYKRIKRAEPKIGDLIFVRSGKGSIGKSTIFVGIPKEERIGISGHLNTVRLKEINPFYVEVLLKSHFGQGQIERFESGTSQQTDFRQESFAAIKIPILPTPIQSHIESEYKKMAVFHDKAMEAKANGDEAGYKKNIETAEAMLKDLIARTEAVIRGEREDVV